MTIQQGSRTLIGILAACVLSLPSAQAAQLGHYVGGFFGATEGQGSMATYDAFTRDVLYGLVDFTPASHVASFDPEDQGYAALVGYRVHRNFAIEGMFGHFGEVKYNASADGTTIVLAPDGSIETLPFSVDTEVSSKLTGIGLYALGIWPINPRWEVYGRAGLQYSTVHTKANIVRTGGTDRRFPRAEAGIARDAAVDLAAGVGMALSLAEIYGVRVEYLRVFDAGSDIVAKGDSDILSIGFIVAF